MAATLIGKKAPLFTAPAVINGEQIVKDFKLADYIGNKYIVLFFYPKDFTFVCPTEILEFQKLLDEFHKRNCEVIGVSTDTAETHWAWLHTPVDKGGIQGVRYPLVADEAKTISYNYGVLGGDYDFDEEGRLISTGPMVAYRATFIIDRQGIIRSAYATDLAIGRSVKETLRLLKAVQYIEKHSGEVCPAEWDEDQETMKPTFEGVASYLSKKFAR